MSWGRARLQLCKAIGRPISICLVARREDKHRSRVMADTAGKADPRQAARLIEGVYKLSESFNITCHFHNTYGAGFANCLAAWDAGVSTFETAFGGLGGCPFTKTTGGNVCTEDLVNLFRRMEIPTAVDISPLIKVTSEAADFFGREMSGCLYKTVPADER